MRQGFVAVQESVPLETLALIFAEFATCRTKCWHYAGLAAWFVCELRAHNHELKLPVAYHDLLCSGFEFTLRSAGCSLSQAEREKMMSAAVKLLVEQAHRKFGSIAHLLEPQKGYLLDQMTALRKLAAEQ